LAKTSFYDAPNPWGPWTVISYNNFNVASEDANNKPTGGWGNFGAASNGLGLNGVPAWTSADGKSRTLVSLVHRTLPALPVLPSYKARTWMFSATSLLR